MALDRERLGQIVRETWVEWADRQPDKLDHPHWCIPWQDLRERDKEVDRRIGEAVAFAVADHLAALEKCLADVSYYLDDSLDQDRVSFCKRIAALLEGT
jgi:glutathione S-transferase